MSSSADKDVALGKANPGRSARTECTYRKEEAYTQ